MGERFTNTSRPGPGQPWWGLWALQDTAPILFPGAPQLTQSVPSDPGQGELEGPGEEAGICLLPHSPCDSHHSTTCWVNPPTNGRLLTVSHSLIVGGSVTVGRLGAGPTAAPTSGWAGFRGNHSLPGNRVGVLMAHSNWGLLRAVLSGTLLQLDKGIPFKSHNPQSMIKAQQPGFSPPGEYEEGIELLIIFGKKYLLREEVLLRRKEAIFWQPWAGDHGWKQHYTCLLGCLSLSAPFLQAKKVSVPKRTPTTKTFRNLLPAVITITPHTQMQLWDSPSLMWPFPALSNPTWGSGDNLGRLFLENLVLHS